MDLPGDLAMKIVLKTAGLPLPGRKREPDMDHATQIIELVNRGYSINASDDESMWSITFSRMVDNAFSNQPEGTKEVLRMFLNYGTENGALFDNQPPPWCARLAKFVSLAVPDTYHISQNVHLTDRNINE